MKRSLLLLTAAVFATLPGCAAPGAENAPAAAAAAVAVEAPELWNFAAAEAGLRAASCASKGQPSGGLATLDIAAEPLNAKQTELLTARLPAGAAFAGAWELKSADPNFGGLSGLAVTGSGSLLAITDSGGWVSIALAAGTPAAATIGYMRGADGKFLAGKGENDAEGLAYRDGIALVSFEREFRIEAFAFGDCGASAKAVEIAGLPGTHEARPIEANAGPEALTLTPDGALRFGFESVSGGVSPIGAVLASGKGEWTGTLAGNPDGFALVGMGAVSLADSSERAIYLYRAFDPVRGARSVLSWGEGETHRLTLSRPVMTDNFEGLAVQDMGPGQVRIWIVSDNNFSRLQRTLLYAFDVSL